MGQTLSLYRLQQTDSQIDRAQARLQAIHKLLENDEALRQVNNHAREAEEHFTTCERLLHQAEDAVRDQRIKIEQTEASLYSGTVHNPKELQDLQNDVAALKRHLNTLEDRQLEAMVALEETEAAHRAAQETRKATELKWGEHNKSLNQERSELQKGYENLSTERAAIAAAIPASFLDTYEQLRQQHRGVAVSRITENACDACGSGLTLAQVQTVRASADLARCPTCGRILLGN